MRTRAFLVAAALAGLAIGCDDDDDNNNVTNPGGGTGGTATCTQTVVAGGSEALQEGTLTAIPFTTTAAGRLDVTVDWTTQSGANLSAFVAAAGSCNEAQWSGGQCTFTGQSGTGTDTGSVFTSKPGRFSSQNVAAGNYDLLVISWGSDPEQPNSDNTEGVSYQVVQSVGSNCPAFPPAS